MKRVIMAIMIIAAAVQAVSAQTNDQKQAKRAKHARTAEAGERKHDPKQMVAKELGLTDEQAEAFAPIYAEYRKAIRGEKPAEKEKFNPAEADDMQTLAHLNEWLDKDIHVATVRKAYIDKFQTVLSAKQIAKLYHMENSFGQNKRGQQHGPQHAPQGGRPNGGPQRGGHGGPAPRG